MRFVIVFAMLGAYLLALAWSLEEAGWLLGWPAASFLLLAAAYAGLGPGLLGKRTDGRMAWWSLPLFWPYLLAAHAVWLLHRRFSREACCNEIVPGLWLGRRVFARELPAGVDLVVDLTAEFSEPRGVRSGRNYLCLPTLDGVTPPEGPFLAVVEKLAGWPGTAYVHCALGHSRSALVVAAVLLARGLAADAGQARALVRHARPGVDLTRPQRRMLDRLQASQAPVVP
jgi:protein-tyrosine phosphatase